MHSTVNVPAHGVTLCSKTQRQLWSWCHLWTNKTSLPVRDAGSMEMRFMHAPIRVQFMLDMGMAKVPVCTNQSSVYAGHGRGQGSCMHQSEFSLCWTWAWPRFLHAPIRVQFMLDMGVAEVPVCTNQSSVYAGHGRGQGSCMHQSDFSSCERYT